MTPFQNAVTFTIKHEGGYVDNSNDPGGETNYGISKREYPNLDIKNLSVADAITIYKRDYWDANNLDSISNPLSIAAFDSIVQHGAGVVKNWLRQSNGSYQTLIQLRRVFYLNLIQKNPADSEFKIGWMNRLNDLGKYCDILATNHS